MRLCGHVGYVLTDEHLNVLIGVSVFCLSTYKVSEKKNVCKYLRYLFPKVVSYNGREDLPSLRRPAVYLFTYHIAQSIVGERSDATDRMIDLCTAIARIVDDVVLPFTIF